MNNFITEDFLMPPNMGPPLPQAWGIYWPWYRVVAPPEEVVAAPAVPIVIAPPAAAPVLFAPPAVIPPAAPPIVVAYPPIFEEAPPPEEVPPIVPAPPAEYYLNVSIYGEGTVTPESGWYTAGWPITLIATPSVGYEFIGWSGDASGRFPVTIRMDSDKSVVAQFKAIEVAPPTVPPELTSELDTSLAGLRSAEREAIAAVDNYARFKGLAGAIVKRREPVVEEVQNLSRLIEKETNPVAVAVLTVNLRKYFNDWELLNKQLTDTLDEAGRARTNALDAITGVDIWIEELSGLSSELRNLGFPTLADKAKSPANAAKGAVAKLADKVRETESYLRGIEIPPTPPLPEALPVAPPKLPKVSRVKPTFEPREATIGDVVRGKITWMPTMAGSPEVFSFGISADLIDSAGRVVKNVLTSTPTVDIGAPQEDDFSLDTTGLSKGWYGLQVKFSEAATRIEIFSKKFLDLLHLLPAKVFYNLTVLSPTFGTVAPPLPPPGGKFLSDTEVVLHATPNPGYVFDHWGGDVSGTSRTVRVKMDRDKLVTAHFVELPKPPPVKVPEVAPPKPPVAPPPPEVPFEEAPPPEEIPVVPTPPPPPVEKYRLTTTVEGAGAIIQDPPSPHPYGEAVRLTAIPATGYRFNYWELDGKWIPETRSTFTFTVMAPHTLKAYFRKI